MAAQQRYGFESPPLEEMKDMNLFEQYGIKKSGKYKEGKHNMTKDVRIGFDVGGTFTDGVMIRGKEVIVKAKSLTTEDVTTGIINALDVLLKTKKADPSEVMLVSLGTTHTTNAIIERKNLNKVGIFRLGHRQRLPYRRYRLAGRP